MTIYLTQKQEEEINRKVYEWHNTTGQESLSSYLHMTQEEYKDFVEYNIIIIPTESLKLENNGKGWAIVFSENTWIAYDKHTNRFMSGWCSYYEVKEEAEQVMSKL